MKIFKSARVLIIIVCAFAGAVVGTDLPSVLRLTTQSALIPIAKAASGAAPTALSPLGSILTGANSAPFGACSDGMNFWVTLNGTDKLARF